MGNGCCTKDTPCGLGEGDCDSDNECAGSLTCGNDNCPWGDGDDCCIGTKLHALKCTFRSGDGRGGTEVKIGHQTGDESIKACIARKLKDHRIKGVTIYANERGGCWCEQNMNRVSASSTYKTCYLQGKRCTGEDNGCCTKDTPCGLGEGDCDSDKECAGSLTCGDDNCPWGDGDDCCIGTKSPALKCTFRSGDGRGGTEVKIEHQTGDECIKACIARKLKDHRINGVTIYANERGGCWCEQNMNSVSASSTYKTCYLQGKRCTGEDNGCCTKDTPCGLGEGDCDSDKECAGSLTCGNDNCPWGDGDDCCID